jgi:hypothetical protein
MCTFIARFLMNGDKVVGTYLVLFDSICIPTIGCVNKLYRIDICDYFDVRFALFTMNEPRRVCSNYELLGEILNMY